MKMEIKSDLLKKMLSNAFGFNIAQSNLLEAPSSKDESESKNDLAVVDEELKYRAGKRLLAEEINKQKNLEDVVQRADDILQAEPESKISQDETDQGWIDECLDGAGKTYNDNLKDYWAKLLAGEIKKPGTYSKRAVSFMKTLSQKDAEKIREMCQYVMYSLDKSDAFILRYKNGPYTYSDLSFLMELRLINSSSFVVKQFGFNDENGGAALYMHGDIGFYLELSQKDYDLPIYSFTELGKEILSVIDDLNANFDYLKDYSNSIYEKNKKLKITCGHIINHEDTYRFIIDDMYFHLPKDEDNIANDASYENK